MFGRSFVGASGTVEIKMRGTFLASANSELAGNATCEMMRSVSLATYGKVVMMTSLICCLKKLRVFLILTLW